MSCFCAKTNTNVRGSERSKRLGKHTSRGWLTFPTLFKHPHPFFSIGKPTEKKIFSRAQFCCDPKQTEERSRCPRRTLVRWHLATGRYCFCSPAFGFPSLWPHSHHGTCRTYRPLCVLQNISQMEAWCSPVLIREPIFCGSAKILVTPDVIYSFIHWSLSNGC